MPDPKQLPFLLRLLDDESEIVRTSVARELHAFGNSLDRELARLTPAPTEEQRGFIRRLRSDFRRTHLREAWKMWQAIADPRERLESALGVLSEFLTESATPERLTEELNRLSEEFLATRQPVNARTLARFLFSFKDFRGSQDDYYNPENNSLLYLLKKRTGIPITLACLYILVGKRLGLEIEGCNFPGHFLASAKLEKETVIVDCFHGGRILDREALATMDPTVTITLEDITRLAASADAIAARCLRNLIHAYEQKNNTADKQLMESLLQEMAESGSEAEPEE